MSDRVQNPPLGEFYFQDLVWTYHVTHGKEIYKTSRLAVIYWDRLHDFIQRKQHPTLYPCKFTKEIIRMNLPNLLRFLHANNTAMVVRFIILNIELSWKSLSFKLLLVHYWTGTWSLEHFTFTFVKTYNQCKVPISFHNVFHQNVVLFLIIFKYHSYFIQCNLYYKYNYCECG